MTLLQKTVGQFVVILVVADVVVIAAERYDLAAGWKVADVALIALGVFFLRVWQEIAGIAYRKTEDPGSDL